MAPMGFSFWMPRSQRGLRVRLRVSSRESFRLQDRVTTTTVGDSRCYILNVLFSLTLFFNSLTSSFRLNHTSASSPGLTDDLLFARRLSRHRGKLLPALLEPTQGHCPHSMSARPPRRPRLPGTPSLPSRVHYALIHFSLIPGTLGRSRLWRRRQEVPCQSPVPACVHEML